MNSKLDRKNMTILNREEILNLEKKQENNYPLYLDEVFRALISQDEDTTEKNSKTIYAMKNIIENVEEKSQTVVDIFNKYCTIDHIWYISGAKDVLPLNKVYIYKTNIETKNIPHKIRKTLLKISNDINENKKCPKSKEELFVELNI